MRNSMDHYNTGHPHSHILARGLTDDGKILNIAGDYIAHGVRERASGIVTLELGRQTDLEVTDQLRREVTAERFTRLDQMLMAEQRANNEFADLRPDKDMLEMMKCNRALLIARAQYLEKLGLAEQIAPGVWHLHDHAEPTLRAMGERGDIIKSMYRALEANGIEAATAFAPARVQKNQRGLICHCRRIRQHQISQITDNTRCIVGTAHRAAGLRGWTAGRRNRLDIRQATRAGALERARGGGHYAVSEGSRHLPWLAPRSTMRTSVHSLRLHQCCFQEDVKNGDFWVFALYRFHDWI